jgi:hypothetical protein
MIASKIPAGEPVALDVTLRWKDDVLSFRHLSQAGAVGAGDVEGSLGRIPVPGFTFARLASGKAAARVPAGEVGTLVRADGGCELIEGPADARLARGDAIELSIAGFSLRAEAVAPEKLALPPGKRRFGAALPIALAAAAHLAVLGLAAQAAMARTADEREEERPAAMRALLVIPENDARARDVRAEEGPGGDGDGKKFHERAGDGRAAGGQRAAGASGAMGNPDSAVKKHGRWAAPERVKNDPDPSLARDRALQDAKEFGMIGLLAQGPDVPVPAPWAGDVETHGRDSIAAWGELWGTTQAGGYGSGGLGLTGIGEGGGGRGEGIGLGTIGTIGHGYGKPGGGTGGNGGSMSTIGGRSWDGIGTHSTRHAIRWWDRWGVDYVNGRLPPETIRRIVHLNFGRIRRCYEDGLRRNPSLEGRVTVRFVIGRDGSVSNVADGGSSLPDKAVVDCVVRVFYGFSYPQPEGGIVTVTYPIVFSPIQ